MQGVRVRSLVGELRSHMPRGQKNIKQKQYCNKFSKDFKNGPPQKNVKRKLDLSLKKEKYSNSLFIYLCSIYFTEI